MNTDLVVLQDQSISTLEARFIETDAAYEARKAAEDAEEKKMEEEEEAARAVRHGLPRNAWDVVHRSPGAWGA